MDWVVQQLDIPLSYIPYAPPFHPMIKLYHLKTVLKYVPEILPSALYIEYHSRSQLQEGDVVAIRSVWGWQSFAMVSSTTEGTENMICFVNRNGKPVSDIEALFWKKGVRLGEVSMEKVLGMEYGPVAIIRQENRAQALRNARSALGREWSFFRFNSEHFVTWAMTGEAKCQQLVNIKAIAQKGVMTGVMTGLATPEGVRIINTVISSIVSSVTKGAATNLMKETAEEAISKTTPVSVGKKMASGAKAGLIVGVVVEGTCLVYSVHGAYQQMQNDEISQEQFRHHVVKQMGATGGSVAGGVAGAAIGSVVIPIPVVGTVIGSVVGSVVGSAMGGAVGSVVVGG